MTNEELVQAYQDGDKEAMTAIVVKNKGLVCHFANQYYQLSGISYLDSKDLEQNGYIGLMNAVKGFDPLLGFKFTTYASQSIKRYIYKSLRFSSPWESKYKKESKLCQVISAFEPVPGTENLTYIDQIEDKDAENAFHNAIIEMDKAILRRELFKVLNTVFEINELKRTFIILKYGLTGKAYTLNEIASMYGLSTEGVRQKIEKGLRKIRSSAIGIQLKEKYQVEYALYDYLEQAAKVEYKNPLFFELELEKFRALIGA
ncbi:sigma-70 family RNA polymerase sigma factor [Acetobacterium bakii]|uniref:RNA polymerase sigma-70 region 2 domain-containing protein n=1 Tax=Acetobacterium bakii TaxID=52689 RepID=A0A0L6TYW7_9FIRM|nr:sigma-70 family RNA polymerase sigma factor [Acetobacterium bakii]KNZ41454.1 hypothetical protein AKG39_11840 [Acetobacterium bakii]